MSSWRGQTAQGPLAGPNINNNNNSNSHNHNNNNNVPVSSQNQEQINNGPRAKCDQVVFEAIAKAAEIVVGSRCWIENIPGSNSSSRFNLLVPEVQGVRSILHRWKRALHVPLRLDVFYQHNDGRRELLERWCLEYAPKTTYSFQHSSADPIVQLRQVCKSIVVWLRTLYGWSRMLPAQALRQRHSLGSDNHVGFSIYVVSEGNDDVTGLITNQGFLSQGQPHSVLTPYGELGWKVFYAPDSMVRQLVPEVPKYSIQQPIAIPNNSSVSQPIPMQQQMNTAAAGAAQTYANPTTHYMSSPQQQQEPSAARSAPSHHPRSPYHRSNSDAGSLPRRSPLLSNAMRRNSDMQILQQTDLTMLQQQQKQQQQQQQANNNGQAAPLVPPKSGPPTKNLSALSLAMLMNNNEDNANVDGETREAAEKRRAALHHAPPQFSSSIAQQQQQLQQRSTSSGSNLATAGEYGYGYNNQLPNNIKAAGGGALRPASPAGVTFDNGSRSASPGPPSLMNTPLSSTPTGFLTGTAPTPPPMVPPLSTLIPPRGGGAAAVTPPFIRPAGFVAEPLPPQPFLPPSAATSASTDNQQQQQQQHSMNHQTSLDLLATRSPFHRPSATPTMMDDELVAFDLNDLMPPDIGGTGFMNPRIRPEDFYYDNPFFGQSPGDEDDMPFAVDATFAPASSSGGGPSEKRRHSGTSLGSASASPAATSNLLLSSANGMASFCSAPPKRLALFDSVANNNTTTTAEGGIATTTTTTTNKTTTEDDMISSLANELAEFKTFGASLMMDHHHQASQSSTSNSTPISLRP